MSAARFIALVICSAMACIAFAGCATSATPAGATTAQKLKDDLSAIAQVEADVKAQCGPLFAPVGATATAILSAAAGVTAAMSGNITAAITAALQLYPIVSADVKGAQCVYGVIKGDYAKLKPVAAAKS